MYDRQYQEFQGRLARLGAGQGDNGRPGIWRSVAGSSLNGDRLSLWRSLGVIALTVILVKAVVLAQIGPADYNDRLTRGDGTSVVGRISTYIMQIDPITEWIASGIHAVLDDLG
jgi:hypothetical protein